MALHLPTMFVMVMTATIVLGAALGVIAFRRHRELTPWAIATALHLVAYILLSLRDRIPDFASIVIGNVLVNAALASCAAGIRRFDDKPTSVAVFAVPMGIIAIGFTWMLDDFHGRMLLGGTVLLAQCLHLLYLLLERRGREIGRGQYILMAGTSIYALAMAFRLIAVLSGADHAARLTDSTPLAAFNFLAALSTALLMATGALAMTLERARHAIAASEARYRTLFDSASEGILVIDETQARLVNRKTCALTGYTEKELIGGRFLDFVHPDDRELAAQFHRQRLAGEADGLTYTIRALTRDRGTRWFQVSGVAFQWQDRPATLNFLTDITEQREAEERIRELAFHDALTGLPNRRLYLDRLRQALAAHARSRRRLAVVFLDLDNFKPLNDTHGHAIGDLLLIEAARRLTGKLRENDTAARFGGDEFALILTDLDADPDAALQQATQVMNKLLDVLAEPYRLPSQGEAVEHRCTASAGVLVCPGGNPDRDELLRRADAAMYRAKQAGRNRVEIESLSD